MKLGTLYGIGVGPGDPDLITVKGAQLLAKCRHIFVPKAKSKTASLALITARKHINPNAEIHQIIFPMTQDTTQLSRHWNYSAAQVATVVKEGHDVCFITLGDALLYSTYIYLIRSIQKIVPQLQVITIPGVTAFSAVAALTGRPIGEGKQAVTIVPAADNLNDVRRALTTRGTVILMKVGRRLDKIIDLLNNTGLVGNSVLVSRAGMEDQRIETDLNDLRGREHEVGYLSTIVVHQNLEAS